MKQLQSAKARVFPLAARVYSELVRRRSTVVVTQASRDDEEIDLGFLIGCFRSGTTLGRYVIDSHSKIASPGETEFLTSLCGLSGDERSRTALELMGFDGDHVRSTIRRHAQYFYSSYGAAKGAELVLDKTPNYVPISNELGAIFPGARFVGLHRHPLDQVNSFTRGLSYRPPEIPDRPGEHRSLAQVAGEYWQESTSTMAAAASALGDRWLDIRYEDLCNDPPEVFAKVFAHLGHDWEPEALEYWRFPHDVGFEGGKALGRTEIKLVHGGWQKWDQVDVDTVLRVTADGRQLHGYGQSALDGPG